MKQEQDGFLREMFADEGSLPVSAEQCLALSYDAIRTESRRKERIISMKNGHTNTPKPMRLLALTAACVLLLGVGALAFGLHTDFFQNAFGSGIEGRDSFTVEDLEGKVEHYPAVERQEVDIESAEALLGHAVAAVGQSVALGDYCFTVESLVMDANGNGALSLTVENPKGLRIKEDGVYYAYEGEFQPFMFNLSQGGVRLSSTGLLVDEGRSDTKAGYVLYFAGRGSAGEAELTISAWDGSFDEEMAAELNNGQVCPNYVETELVLPGAAPVGAKAFSGDGIRAELSPVGMLLEFDGGEDGGSACRELLLCYEDGEEFVVQSDERFVSNQMKAFGDSGRVWMVFNRLVEPESVESIYIAGHHNAADYEQHLLPAEK